MNSSTMNSAAGTTSKSTRSNGARGASAALIVGLLAASVPRAGSVRRPHSLRAAPPPSGLASAMPRPPRSLSGFPGIHEHALGQDVHVHLGARRNVDRRTYMQPCAATRNDVDERIASTVFDVVHSPGDDVLRRGYPDDCHLFRPDRNRRSLACERKLAHAGQPDVGCFDGDAIAALAGDVDVQHVAITHE